MTNDQIPVDDMIPLTPGMSMPLPTPPKSMMPKPAAPMVPPPRPEAPRMEAPPAPPPAEPPTTTKAELPKPESPKAEPTRRPLPPRRTLRARVAEATGVRATRKQAAMLGAAALSLGVGLYAMKLISPSHPATEDATETALHQPATPALVTVAETPATQPVAAPATPEKDVVHAPIVETVKREPSQPLKVEPARVDEPLTLTMPKAEEPPAPLTINVTPEKSVEPRALPRMEIVREPEATAKLPEPTMKLPEPGGLPEPTLPGLIQPVGGSGEPPALPKVPPSAPKLDMPALPAPPAIGPASLPESPAASPVGVPPLAPPSLPTPPKLDVPTIAPPAFEPAPLVAPAPMIPNTSPVVPVPATLPAPDSPPMIPATLPTPLPSPSAPEPAPRVNPASTEPVVGSPIDVSPTIPMTTPVVPAPAIPSSTPPAMQEFVPTPAVRDVPPATPPVRETLAPAVSPTPAVSGVPTIRPTGGSEVRPSTPTTVPERPVRTDYDVGLHEPRAGETYETISEEWYNSRKLAAALRAYNRNKALQGQGPVEVPPIDVLRKAYPQFVNGDARTTAVPSATSEWTAPAGRAEPAYRPVGGREFVVPAGGMTMREAARAALGSDMRWGELFEANPEVTNPGAVLSPGTRLRLP